MVQNTLENKAKFFAQDMIGGSGFILTEESYYDGIAVQQAGFKFNFHIGKTPKMFAYCSDWLENFLSKSAVVKRPLASLTDEEAIEVSYILNPAKPENQIDLHSNLALKQMHVGIIKNLLFNGEIYSKSIWNLNQATDYLKDKGFALPYHGLPVEGEVSQVAYGWVVLKEN